MSICSQAFHQLNSFLSLEIMQIDDNVFVCRAAELSTDLRQHGTAPCTTLCF